MDVATGGCEQQPVFLPQVDGVSYADAAQHPKSPELADVRGEQRASDNVTAHKHTARGPFSVIQGLNCQLNAEQSLAPTGGAKGNRTPNLRLAKAALCQLSYGPEIFSPECRS